MSENAPYLRTTDMPEAIQRLLQEGLPDVPVFFADEGGQPVVAKAACWLPVSEELLNPPEPTPEERERWRLRAERQATWLAALVEAHPARVEAAAEPLRSILELHGPVDRVCEGCDYGGYEGEPPDFPCRTYLLAVGEEPSYP